MSSDFGSDPFAASEVDCLTALVPGYLALPTNSAIFGGGEVVRWLHPWLGLVLAVAFLGLFVRFFWQNLPEFTDFVWPARIRHVLTANDQYLPEIGKYNAGQKFVFWSQFVRVGTLLVTGIGLWEAGLHYFEDLLGFQATIEQKRLAAVIHASAAVLAIAIWIIHAYAAIWVRGTLSAMTRGTVSGGWGWRHHRKWLRKEVQKGENRAAAHHSCWVALAH